MTKKTRLEKAWGRKQNLTLWMCKGVYFNMCKPIKYCMTPKQVMKYLKKEHIQLFGNNR